MYAWGKKVKVLVFRMYVCVKAKLTLVSFFFTFFMHLPLEGLALCHLSSFTFISFLRICHSKIWNLFFHQSLKSFKQDEKKEGTEIKTYMFMLRKRIQFNTIL